jgi:dipeptidyl aminopeptidase/acylaminoacyl peptidase
MDKLVGFEIESDNITLHGKINFVSFKSPLVIFIPGVSGKALTDKFDWIAKVFVKSGYNFVRFNFNGYEDGRSFENSSLGEEIRDFNNVLKTLDKMGLNISNYGVVAKSLGALKAIAIQDPRLKCLGLLSPAVSLDNHNNLKETANYIYKNIGEYMEYKIDSKMLNNFTSSILFYGDRDTVVKITDTKKLFEHMSEPKEIYCIKQEGHGLDKPETQLFISKKLILFFKKHFPVVKP